MAGRLRFAFLLSASALLAACYAPAGAVKPPPPSQPLVVAEKGTPELPAKPVDTDLATVSRSAPSKEAKVILALCARDQDLPNIVGMALLPTSRDVAKYMMAGGKDPELQDDTPVWLVQFEGEIQYRWGSAFHPVCMVKGGEPSIFAPYGGRGPDGTIWLPPADYKPATLALPPLAP